MWFAGIVWFLSYFLDEANFGPHAPISVPCPLKVPVFGTKEMRIFLLMLLFGLSGCQSEKRVSPTLISGELITCINTDEYAACFEVPPNHWTPGDPNLNFSLFRASEHVIVAGNQHVCLDSGLCWGNSDLWSMDMQKEILNPININKYKSIKTSDFLSCGITKNGDVDCWGRGLSLSSLGITKPIGRQGQHFMGLNMRGFNVCAWNKHGLQCWQLAGKLNLLYSSEVMEYGEACLGINYICARKLQEFETVECWADRGRLVFNNVKEFGCGEQACFQTNDNISCVKSPGPNVDDSFGPISKFDLQLKSFVVGKFHFCGINSLNHVVCRIFEDVVWNTVGLTPWNPERDDALHKHRKELEELINQINETQEF